MLNVDFEKLVLTGEEKSALKELSTGKVLRVNSNRKDSLYHLKSINFVNYYAGDEYGTRDSIGDILYAVITDDGNRYLLYLKSLEEKRQESQRFESEKEKRQFKHDWKIAVYSSIIGAILSRPIWDAIDWVLQTIAAWTE